MENHQTIDSFESPRRWYAVHTKPCHEKRVAELLEVREVKRFLPVYRTTHRWNNGCRVTLEKPLFPGYLFVNICPRERLKVLGLFGVVSIIGSQLPEPLPDSYIERLRRGLPLLNAEPHPVLTVGERVRICRGPLEGIDGIIARNKNSLRVVLTVELIARSVAVEVCTNDLKPIPLPRAEHCEGMTCVAN